MWDRSTVLVSEVVTKAREMVRIVMWIVSEQLNKHLNVEAIDISCRQVIPVLNLFWLYLCDQIEMIFE